MDIILKRLSLETTALRDRRSLRSLRKQSRIILTLSLFVASMGCLSARCVGECGLDFSDGFPSAELQIPWFERQVQIACEVRH